jgi:hypothetical protein
MDCVRLRQVCPVWNAAAENAVAEASQCLSQDLIGQAYSVVEVNVTVADAPSLVFIRGD